MSLLTRAELQPLLNSGEQNQIFVSPILDEGQVGAVSIDLRLGYDFLVSVPSRQPSIELGTQTHEADLNAFFQRVRRDMGETFTIHPSQTVLAMSLEYIGLPASIYADVTSRSSYNRLGLGVHAVFQPGFRGCASLELHNHSNIPIELVVGAKVVQARFYSVSKAENYFGAAGGRRKYIGQIRPVVSRAFRDSDLERLKRLSKPQSR